VGFAMAHPRVKLKLELYRHAIASSATADVTLASIDGLREGILI